jgi:hypothetical protein
MSMWPKVPSEKNDTFEQLEIVAVREGMVDFSSSISLLVAKL